METLRKFVTQKYTAYGCIASGILALILFIMYQTMGSSFSNISDLGNAVSSVKMLCNLYYVNLVLLLVLLAAYVFLLCYVKNRYLSTKVLAGCSGFATLMSLIGISAVNFMKSVLSGNFSTLFKTSTNSLDSFPTIVILMILAQLVLAGIAIYATFIKKESTDTETTAGEPASLEDTKNKFKDYYATEKGKRNVRIFGMVGIAVIVLIIAFSIYQGMKKTVIDLTSTCNVTFVGVSGEGSANINCSPDYDHSNEKIKTFMQGVSYSIEKNGELSNGDAIVVTASYSEATADSNKIKVENTEKKINVKGLEEVYHTYADVPKAIKKGFEATSKSVLEKNIKSKEGTLFGADSINIASTDLIGTYYSYESLNKTGTLHYIYRVSLSEEYSYATYKNVDYYDVQFSKLSPSRSIDYSDGSDAIRVRDVSIYDKEKTDAKAVKQMKEYNTKIETVKENLSKETYKDETIKK